MIFSKDNTPSWIILIIDLGIVALSLSISYLVRFNFNIPEVEYRTFSVVYPAVLVVRLLGFYFGKTYRDIIRYTSSKDTERLFIVVSLGTLALGLLNILNYYFGNGTYIVPLSVLIIEFLSSIFLLISFRVAVKLIYFEIKNSSNEKKNIIIYGAGESGVITKRTLDRVTGVQQNVIAFIDDNSRKIGKKIEGISIYAPDSFESLMERFNVDAMIISIQNLSRAKKDEIVEMALKYKVDVLNVPPASSWIGGELSYQQIRQVKIEDLLGREEIKLDEKNIRDQLFQKTVLITGAAGSIGSEIVRQVAGYTPERLILLDQAESPLYELQLEVETFYGSNFAEVVVADVRDRARMKEVFKRYRPKVVYHAAAYKHVPMMEENPSEAIQTNVFGTKNCVDLADEFKVGKFVMISTDKAVNPTNVMGASKRIAEIYSQSMNQKSQTKYVTTRFGNVLGSNGSVIPLFKRQIEQGGPITVTHPEITRYFMTIPEACQLVLEAGMMGDGGEIYIFDMGQSVKISELAKKMVKLSGLEIGKDIQIQYVGLRPGEKLFEELLAEKENTLPTHHPQIMVAQVREYSFKEVEEHFGDLERILNEGDAFQLVQNMKHIVPEYVPKNSVFEKLNTSSESSFASDSEPDVIPGSRNDRA
jgi:FlaA1/EpsC-like NDP-sugar epimerase